MKTAGKMRVRITAFVMSLLFVLAMLPSLVFAESEWQTWITFNGTPGAKQVSNPDGANYYLATSGVEINAVGTAVITYTVDGGRRYGHVRVLDMTGSAAEGVSVDEPDETSRTATISGLKADTGYSLFWDHTDSNNNLSVDVYLTFTTVAAGSSGGELPTQDWITFDGNTQAALDSADALTGIVYKANAKVPFNSLGQAVITYSVNGGQKYGHAHLLDAGGQPVESATVDEPDGTSRTATVSGLAADTDYQLFWDKDESNGKLSYNVYLKFTVGADQTWMTLPNAVYRYSDVGGENDTDYYEASEPLEFGNDGTIVWQYQVSGAKRYAHLNVQDAAGNPVDGAAVDEPDEENRTATVSGLKGETAYRFFWDSTQSNGRLNRHIVMLFTTGKLDEDRLQIRGVEKSYDYTGQEIRPEPEVFCRDTQLIKDTDYTVSYSEDTVNAGVKTLTVTGLGAHEGKTSVREYTINKVSLEAAVVTLPEGTGTTEDGTVTYAYTGSEVKPEPIVTVGTRTLTPGVDYAADYYNAEDPENTDLVNAGTGAKLTVEISQTAAGNYIGGAAAKPVYTIVPKEIKPSVKAADRTYTGKAITPSVTVKDGTKTLKKGVDYTVDYGTGRRNVGQYRVSVTLQGNYSGSGSASFKINPKGTALSAVLAGNKKFTAKWKKQTAKMARSTITGYQLQYSLKKGFTSGSRKDTVKGAGKNSRTVKKLKSGKYYYVRIRTYKTVSGVKCYSPWSSAKRVKIK